MVPECDPNTTNNETNLQSVGGIPNAQREICLRDGEGLKTDICSSLFLRALILGYNYFHALATRKQRETGFYIFEVCYIVHMKQISVGMNTI